MQYIPAPPPSPIEIGLQQLFQGWGQGRAKQRQDQLVNQDLATLQNMLNPEMNELDAKRRYAQGLPLLQGQANRYTGEAGTLLPQLLSPQGQSAMMNIAMQKQLSQILNPLQAQQLQQGAESFPLEQEGRKADIEYKKSATIENMAQAKAAFDRKTAGPLTTAKLGDGTGLDPGTVFQVDANGVVNIKQKPKEQTIADKKIQLYEEAIAKGDEGRAFKVLGISEDVPEDYKAALKTTIKAAQIQPDKKVELFQELASEYPDYASKSHQILIPSYDIMELLMASFASRK